MAACSPATGEPVQREPVAATHDAGAPQLDVGGPDASLPAAAARDASTGGDARAPAAASTDRVTDGNVPFAMPAKDAGELSDAKSVEPEQIVEDAAVGSTSDASATMQTADGALSMPDAAVPLLGQGELGLWLVSTHYEGELCPPGSVIASEAGDHSALTITFSADVQGGMGVDSLSKRCTLKLGLDVPVGYAFSNLHVYASGAALGSEGSADLTMRYGFAGQSATQTASFAPLTDEYVEYARFDELWSPSCVAGQASRVELVLDVEAHVTGDYLLGLSALDVAFTYPDGARWKRCADGQIVAPAPSARGEDCAGPPKQPCTAGLVCDLIDSRSARDELLTGVCVDPEGPAATAAVDESCGGVANIPCAPSLRCHYTSAQRAALGARGTCTLAGGDVGDRCGGYPVLKCGDGLFCNSHARDRCQPGNENDAAN